MRDFQRGENAEAYAEVKNQAGVYADPTTSITVTYTDSAGTAKVTAQAMSKFNSETGKYYYQYILATDAALGWWTVEVTVTDGTVVTKTRCGFRVIV